jgi:hypothetical protein
VRLKRALKAILLITQMHDTLFLDRLAKQILDVRVNET